MTESSKGNWGDESAIEETEHRELFGIPIDTHPNYDAVKKDGKRNYQYANWFILCGKTYKWVDNPHVRIPKNPDNPNSTQTKEADTWQEFLIAVGELHYGARYNKDTNKLEKRPQIANKNIEGIQKHMRNMSGVEVDSKTNVPKGWSRKILEPAIAMIKCLKVAEKLKSVQLTQTETDEEKKKREAKSFARTKILPRDDFMGTENKDGTYTKSKLQSVEDYKRRAKYNGNLSDSKINTNLSNLYNFCLVTGYTGFPEHYTLGYVDYSFDKKITELKLDMTRYTQFAMTRSTPKSWWEKMADIGFTPEIEWHITTSKDELGKDIFVIASNEFKGVNIKFNVTWSQVDDEQFKNRLLKSASARNWEDGVSGRLQRKTATDAIRSWIQFGGSGETTGANWKLPDQTPASVLSSSVYEAVAPSLGRDLNDKEIMAGLKFLETGKRWLWKKTGNFKEYEHQDDREYLTVKDKDGNDEEIKNPEFMETITSRIEIEELVVDDDDHDPHYNTSLTIYEKWGTPYGKLAPANMFVRLALSGTGWRKSEALTCRNVEITESTSAKEKSGFYFESAKYEGEPDILQVVFQTRKTERLGGTDKQHTSAIAPVSSKLLDNRHTIELVMKKNNQKKYESPNSFKIINIDPKQQKLNRQAEDYINKRSGKGWKRAEGEVAQTMIGLNNQFLPVDQLTTKLGADIDWKGTELSAYLYVPLKEMYTMMEHTKVSVNSEAEIHKWRQVEITDDKIRAGNNKKRLGKIDETIYPVDDFGWSKSPNKNAPQKFSIQRKSQDKFRWKDPDGYWTKRPMHSIRHVFAQVWLRKSAWNFGLVAMFGHWKIIDTLKANYGERSNTEALKQMISLIAKTESDQETRELEIKLKKILSTNDAVKLKEDTADQKKTKAEIAKLQEGETD